MRVLRAARSGLEFRLCVCIQYSAISDIPLLFLLAKPFDIALHNSLKQRNVFINYIFNYFSHPRPFVLDFISVKRNLWHCTESFKKVVKGLVTVGLAARQLSPHRTAIAGLAG